MKFTILLGLIPRVDPKAGDVLRRWSMQHEITRVEQGMVFTVAKDLKLEERK